MFFFHVIGKFNLKLATLHECSVKWLDWNEKRVEEIAISVVSNPAVIHNGQPWLAIADVTKDDLARDKKLIRGAKLELIGGLHRYAVVKKVTRNSFFQSQWVAVCKVMFPHWLMTPIWITIPIIFEGGRLILYYSYPCTGNRKGLKKVIAISEC